MENLPKINHNTQPPDSMDLPRDYQLLSDGNESTGLWTSGEEIRMDYLKLTDRLIHTITDGIVTSDKSTGETVRTPYSTVIFLDKSARPLSHLVRECWPKFAKDIKTGETPAMPAIKFLNIDRRQWVDRIDPNGSGLLDINRIDPTFIYSLRSIFLTPEGKKAVERDGMTREVEKMPSILDNQGILVVDETSYSGETLKIATGLVRRAFPTSQVNGTHWMNQKVNGNARNPRWYRDNGIDNKGVVLEAGIGTGVSDRMSETKSRIPSEDFYAKFGAFFLSSPHWRVKPGLYDKRYKQLIKEFKSLAASPDVPVLPDLNRGDHDGYYDRLVAYNSVVDPSKLSPAEKEDIIRDVIDQKNKITAKTKRRRDGV